MWNSFLQAEFVFRSTTKTLKTSTHSLFRQSGKPHCHSGLINIFMWLLNFNDPFFISVKFVKNWTRSRKQAMTTNGVEKVHVHTFSSAALPIIIHNNWCGSGSLFFIDYRQTSMSKYMDVFDTFVRRLEISRQGIHGASDGLFLFSILDLILLTYFVSLYALQHFRLWFVLMYYWKLKL